ncbi:APC family permease [Fusobacterium varium]|jgi:amino acid transporter|uniref:APC family permease n=1 Tax=Fusobacterium varium TaxID=856 RepID=UPI002FF13994
MSKKITKFGVVSLAVGAIIGWGAFILPGELFIKEIGILNSIIGLFIGAVIMIIIETNYQYMMNICPVSGGEIAYVYRAFGRKQAFITGWFLALAYLCIIPLNATALILIVQKFSATLLKKGLLYIVAGYPIYLVEILVISTVIIIFAYFNIKGLHYSSNLQNVMVIFLTSIITIMIIFIFVNSSINKALLISQVRINNFKVNSILKIIAIAPWAYIGFDTLPQVAEDLNFSNKKISLLAIISILIGFLIYSFLIIITGVKFTAEILNNNFIEWATGEAVEKIFGRLGLVFLGISLLMAITAGINGFYIATSKLLCSMAEGKMLPNFFAKKTKEGIPKNAIIFLMLVSLITPWFGRKVLLWIVDMSSFGAALGYFYTCLSSFKLAKDFKDRRNIILGFIGLSLGIIFLILLLYPSFSTSLTYPSYIALLLWIVLGIMFYKKISLEYNSVPKEKLDKLILKRK